MLEETAVNTLVDRMTREGFVVLPTVCGDALLQQFMDAARQRIDEVMAVPASRQIGIGSAAGFLEIVQRSPGRWDLPISPRRFGVRDSELPWWPLVVAMLGADAEHSFSGVVFSEPGSPAQEWHIDSPHVDVEHRPAHALNVLMALHDIPLAMGPTEIARASHRMTNHLRYPNLKRDQLVYQSSGTSPETLAGCAQLATPARWVEPLAAGSCLVFDDRILHRGLANHSDRARYVVYFSYRKSGYAENTHFESQRSVFG